MYMIYIYKMIYTTYNIYIFIKFLYNFFFFSSEVFFKIALLKNFTKFTGNICARISFSIKFQLGVCNLIRTETPAQLFSVTYKIFKNIPFVEHLRTAPSEKGSIKSNSTVRRLSKIFLSEKLVFW